MAKQRIGRVHMVIPDVQAKPGVPIDHLEWVGNYAAEKRPDVIVCIGDFADMPSLNSHGKLLELEGQRYSEDIRVARLAMHTLLKPIRKVKGYNPRMVLTMGNHEERIDRVSQEAPKFSGTISSKDLGYAVDGWEVIPFLKPIKIDGIEYVHFFTSGVMGRPVSSASAILKERQCSGVMGHVQFTDLAFHKKTGNFALFSGICYQHDENYLGFQGNTTRRQIVMLNEVREGTADPMFVSLNFLKARYS